MSISKQNTRRRCGALIAAIALASAPRVSRATPNFPDALVTDLTLEHTPGCTACHTSNGGGRGTVVRAFGAYMRSRGLVAFDEASLKNASAALSGEAKAGVPEPVAFLAALHAGTDPNKGFPDVIDGPTYGCEARWAGARTEGATGATIAIGSLALLVRRRRARRR